MSSGERPESADRLTTGLALLGRLSAAAGAMIARRAGQLVVTERREVGRAASIFAFALAAAVFACAAAVFAALALMAALGEAHRVLGAACVAAGFALLAVLAILFARQNLRDR